MNRKEAQNLGGAGTAPPWGEGVIDLKTNPLPICVTMSHLVVL